jgi:CheY-like chemotaxis protein
MAALLGHSIELDSVPGKGSVFRIAVPMGIAGVAQQQPVRMQSELAALQVLCLDNEPAILAGMQSLLQQWGCEVTCAPSLREALQRYTHAAPPDVVLADYHLDEETGIDVLEALSLHWQQPIKAIVISADNSDQLRNVAKAKGYLFLPKPVKPAALRSCLRNLSR